MGNLFSFLSKEDQPKTDLFVDFEDAAPTESELEVWTAVKDVLNDANAILQDMPNYNGASNEIREAISNPHDDEIQTTVWENLCPLVQMLGRYYEFSKKIEWIVPVILDKLCSGDMTSHDPLQAHQALFKQFAEILDFTLKFDDWKMMNPAIQNDFSYYRRRLNQTRMSNGAVSYQADVVSDEMANKMSLFYANATPMLRTLSECTTLFISQRKEFPIEKTTDTLAKMANICRTIIETQALHSRFKNCEETVLFCLRLMVGAIILYDHVHPVGAFVKTSAIDVKKSVSLLKVQESSERVEGLLNALRYSTKHLNDDTTPKNVKAALALSMK